MLNPLKQKSLIALLQEMTPGETIPNSLYNEFARLFRFPALEVIIYKKNKTTNSIEILLGQRPADDPFFANQWHSPGTMLRFSDNKLEHGFKRILNEIGITKFKSNPKLVGLLPHTDPRGPSIHLTFIAEINQSPKNNTQYYPVNKLPKNLTPSQKELIRISLPFFKKASG